MAIYHELNHLIYK